jgi:hypothetical protein
MLGSIRPIQMVIARSLRMPGCDGRDALRRSPSMH